MCQSCHVRAGSTYRTAERNCRDTGEGAAGLTTHAPHASHTVTLPDSLDEAVAALTAMPAAVPVAGGTDLMAAVNAGLLRPAALVGLGKISEIRGWQYLDGHALLGAGLTLARMGRPDFAALIPGLAAAARAAGPPQVRNAGDPRRQHRDLRPYGRHPPGARRPGSHGDHRRPRRQPP